MYPHTFFSTRSLFSYVCATALCIAGNAWAQSPIATSPTTPTILARAPGNVVITTMDIQSELQRAPSSERLGILARPDAVQQIVSNLLLRRLLAGEAQRDGLATDPLVAASVRIASDRALSDARLQKLDTQNTPSEAGLEAYAQAIYKSNDARFEQPAQTRASHILLDNTGPESLAKAKDLLQQLRAGASFADLAKQFSTDKGSAGKGGDLGFFGPGKMVRPFEDAVNALAKPGDLSEPVESQFGYHIIRLDERKPKGKVPFADVKAGLMSEARASLLNEARQQKAHDMAKDFVFERPAIEALAPGATR